VNEQDEVNEEVSSKGEPDGMKQVVDARNNNSLSIKRAVCGFVGIL